MSVDLYRDKYIKYKGKYLNLKNLQGGVLNPSDLGEHWFLVTQEGVDLLSAYYIINQMLGKSKSEAPALEEILKLLKTTKDISYSIRLGDSTLKNLSNNKTTDKTLNEGFRFGFSKSPEDMKKLNMKESLFFKATTFYKMREDAFKSGVPNVYLSDDQIDAHLSQLMSLNGLSANVQSANVQPVYHIVHIDVNKNKNLYLSDKYSLSAKSPDSNIIVTNSDNKKISIVQK